MTLINVNYINVKDLSKEQKKDLDLDVTLKKGIVAVESYSNPYRKKARIIKRGMVNYILNGY
jgi:hypothetical protein